MLTQAQQEDLRRLAADLQAAPRGGKRPMVEAVAARLGVSVPTVYRALREVAGAPVRADGEPRKKRNDAGRRSVDRDLALQVAGLVHTARRANGKRTMSLDRAVEILAANGQGAVNAETGEVAMPSVSTLSRAMREYGCHPAQLAPGTPAGRVRSPHPNHSWQTDASVCVLYYMPGGKMALLDERTYNERKPGRLVDIGNQRITRYPVVDHCTGCFYVHYAVERGESATGALTALIEAMSDRGPRDPMHGVPFHLYTDPGSAYRSSLLREFCGRLGIRLQHHAAGAARATGAVEVVQNIIERQFESRLRFADVSDLGKLQAMADRWRRHYNATARHARLGMPRAQAWTRIRPDQLREASRDALIAISHWRHEERTVSDRMTVRVQTRLPGLPPQEYDLRNLAWSGVRPGDKVRVELSPFRAPAIIVIKTMPDGEERRWEVQPIIKDEWGFDAGAPIMGEAYQAMPETDSAKAARDIARAAAPARAEGEAKARPYADLDIMADVREAPLFLRPEGRDILTGKTQEALPIPLSHAQASVRLRSLAAEAFARDARACMDYVRERYPYTVPEDALTEVAAELTRRFAPHRAARLSFNNDQPAAPRRAGGAA